MNKNQYKTARIFFFVFICFMKSCAGNAALFLYQYIKLCSWACRKTWR